MGISALVERLRCSLPGRMGGENGACIPVQTWTGALKAGTPINEIPFVVFDTELTGLNTRSDHIVSIGAVSMSGATIHMGHIFDSLVRPPEPVPAESVLIHGITPDDLEAEDNLQSVMPEFLKFIRNAVLVGHFVDIDTGFVNRYLRRKYGTCLKNPAIDTRAVHDWLYLNSPRFRRHYRGGSERSDLFSLAERYGVDVLTAHDALGDAYVTAQLFQRFLYFLKDAGVCCMSELQDIGRG